jgi:hypothetical protein
VVFDGRCLNVGGMSVNGAIQVLSGSRMRRDGGNPEVDINNVTDIFLEEHTTVTRRLSSSSINANSTESSDEPKSGT